MSLHHRSSQSKDTSKSPAAQRMLWLALAAILVFSGFLVGWIVGHDSDQQHIVRSQTQSESQTPKRTFIDLTPKPERLPAYEQEPSNVQALLQDLPSQTSQSQDILEDVPSNTRETDPPAPVWQRYASPVQLGTLPKIVIVIDDMGVNQTQSEQVLLLPGPLTLAYLPYAQGIARQTEQARSLGHELMVHMPMEPTRSDIDPGPQALYMDNAVPQWQERLNYNYTQFGSYVGFNNHMGSLLTTDERAMDMVMADAANRGVLFLDSKTTAQSVAAKQAKQHGVPFAVRDVFLDHEETQEFLQAQLAQTERIAKRMGYAIAIGHPKAVTVQALQTWLPQLADRGFQLVPISAVVTDPRAAPPPS